jgi:hypothetical protein
MTYACQICQIFTAKYWLYVVIGSWNPIHSEMGGFQICCVFEGLLFVCHALDFNNFSACFYVV